MRWGQRYFAVQALGGAAWWAAVFSMPAVRDATLGGLDPVVVAIFDIPLFVLASAIAAFGVRSAAVLAAAWTALVTLALAGYATLSTEAGWGVLAMVAASVGSTLAACLIVRGRIPTDWIIRGPFAFRPAAIRSPVISHMAATLGQIVVFWGFFLLVLPLLIGGLENRWQLTLPFAGFLAPAGIVVLAAASALGIWAAIVMSALGGGTPLPSAMPNRMVIAGPYRWVRNPMALAGIVQGAAVGLILSSWLVVGYALAGSLIWNYVVRPYEEADLEGRFGDQFRRYRDSVWCWLPRLPSARSTRASD
jgi:protein-S-isoprenylcysteine O-methyltransferase Ste14